jgi:hypothetical protein
MKKTNMLFLTALAALTATPLITAEIYYQSDYEADTVGNKPAGKLVIESSSSPSTNGGFVIDANSDPANPLTGQSLYIYDLSGSDTTNRSTRAFLEIDQGRNVSNLRVDFDFQRTYEVSPDEPTGDGAGTGILFSMGRSGDDPFSGEHPFWINLRNSGFVLVGSDIGWYSVPYSEPSNHLTVLVNSHDSRRESYDYEDLGTGSIEPNEVVVFLNDELVGAFPFIQQAAPDFYSGNDDLGQIVFGQFTHSQGGIVFDNMVVQSISDSDSASLVNISTRGWVGTGDQVLIGGFIISGEGPEKVLIRAAGPALGELGVNGILEGLVLTLFDVDGNEIARNDHWDLGSDPDAVAAAAVSVGAFPFVAGSRDSALLVTLEPGAYTAQISGNEDTTGVALMEVYSVD